MDKWKTICLVSVGFSCGIAFTVACNAGSQANAIGNGSGRAVVEVRYLDYGEECATGYFEGTYDCCPVGFTAVGVGAENGSTVVCLED